MNNEQLVDPNGEGMSWYPFGTDRELWELEGYTVDLERDVQWYIGCMHMAAIFLDKRYAPEEAFRGSHGFNPVHMRNLGMVLCEDGNVEWWRWPDVYPASAATPDSIAA